MSTQIEISNGSHRRSPQNSARVFFFRCLSFVTLLAVLLTNDTVYAQRGSTSTRLDHQTNSRYLGAGGVMETWVKANSNRSIKFQVRNNVNNRVIPNVQVVFYLDQGGRLIELGTSRSNLSGNVSYNFRPNPTPNRTYTIVARFAGGSGFAPCTNRIRVITR